MSIRKVTLALGVCLAASVAALGQSGAGYIFQIPGQGSTSAAIAGYPYAATPLAPSVNTLGPNGTFKIIPKPDGTGYYVLGATLQVANPTFSTFTTVNGISGTPTAVAASPDGNYAVVGAGSLYILSASTTQILTTLTTNGTIVGVAISQDSQNAYVLSNSPYGSFVTQISLATKTQVGTALQLTGGATTIAFSPLGLLYVGAVNRIFEINPATLTVTPNGTMTPNATPGPLQFTPDGTTMYFVNQTSNVTGGSIVQITLATYGVASYPPASGVAPTPLDAVFVAGNGRVFAVSYSTTTLFDVATSPLGLSVSSLNSVVNAQGVLGAAISSELPSALYLYLIIQTSGQPGLYRISLATNQISTEATAALSGGTLQFVGVPPETGAASFLTYGNNQTVAQTKTSLPLSAVVLDLTGRPIFDLPVSFTTPSGNGVVINTPNPTTNANGYVQTTITAPAASGTFTITLTAGTANTTFTVNVPGTGGSSGTGTNGVSQVFIVTGNGQLVETGYSTNAGGNGDHLTVLVTDVNGVPLPGVSVAFNVTSGTGGIATVYTNNGTGSTTNAQGLAYADFVAGTPANDADFEMDTVVASSPYGSVSFDEIEYAAIIQGTPFPAYPPGIILETPTIDTSRTVTVAEGSVATNAVTALITGSSAPQAGQPIAGVAIRIIDPNNVPAASPYASCQGSTLSDNTGTAHCNLVATCGNGTGSFSVGYMVGDYVYYQGTVTVTKGSAQTLTILSGNNQTGNAGQALSFPLVATITDACGVAVGGASVTWTVTQGSATLSQIVSTSGSSGQVSAHVTFGAAPGTVQVTATLGTSSVVTFNLTSQAVVSTLTAISGNNQTATVGTVFALPLTVQIKDASGNAISGATISFAVSSGNATISPTSAATNSSGTASTTVTAGQTAGTILVTASYGSVSASFTLNAVAQGPTVTASGFQNAASFVNGLVPCGLATATGSGIAAGITGTVSGASFFAPLPDSLNGLSLTVSGTPAPIYQLSNTNGKQQVTFQTPCEATPTTNGTVVVTVNGASSTVTGVPILQAQPGIFYYTGTTGLAYGEVISASNGSYVTATNPAIRGQNYYLIATGLGQVTPATATDSLGVSGQTVNAQVIVGVSNLGVPVFSQTYQPGEIGVYAIGFTIPLTNPAGANQPLALAVVVNGQTLFANPVYIPAIQ